MCPKTTRAVPTLHDLYPKVVKNSALDTARINASVQRTEGGADRLLKLFQGSPEVREAFQFQLESCHGTCNRIYVDTDDICA